MINVDDIFKISDPKYFKDLALKIYDFQYKNNRVYRQFCNLNNKNLENVQEILEIPFLPISFFKTHKILSSKKIEKTFFSSGTTNKISSKHFVSDLNLYEKSFLTNFQENFGDPRDYTIIGLLPNYLENKSSSLIYMVNKLIQKSSCNESGFYLEKYEGLIYKLLELENLGKKIILIGVSYALLDLIEVKKIKLKNTIIIETGGMKGKRKEMIKSELHEILKSGFGTKNIQSEYGMTELLSQAYSKKNGIFKCPKWMKIFIRDINDPNNLNSNKKTGGINIIDLANIYSCSFIATDDLGKMVAESKFEVLGRIDNSDIRGCNLLI
tara:strand:- start:9 stop:983 length:975 start_codon:yes stop_codon:yes gene_type:complete